MNAATATLPVLVQTFPRAHILANGRLYRAIVSLPEGMCPKGEPLHERIVFFDGPCTQPVEHLETLLAHAWNTQTTGWAEDGFIYNVEPAFDLIEQGVSADLDARLFELSWGGPEGVGYADPARVDLFLAPVLKARLQTALAAIATTAKKGGAA